MTQRTGNEEVKIIVQIKQEEDQTSTMVAEIFAQ
jgi:hypothetical protein